MKGETETFTSVNHSGTVLAPAMQVFAWESSSILFHSSTSGSQKYDKSMTCDRHPLPLLLPFAD
jgi:hypothetical protein